MRPALLFAAVAATLALAVPAAAGATTYCVLKPDCTGDHTQSTFLGAVQAANTHGGPDRIELGAAQFSGAVTVGAGNQVDIAGIGNDTVLTAPNGNNVTVLTVNEPTSTVSNLAIHLGSGTGNVGLSLAGATADAVNVSATDTSPSPQGVFMGSAGPSAAAFRHGSVILPVGGSTVGTGVTMTAFLGIAKLEDSAVQAPDGVANFRTAEVRRVAIRATHGVDSGTFAIGGGVNQTLIEDCTVNLVASGSTSTVPHGILGGSRATCPRIRHRT